MLVLIHLISLLLATTNDSSQTPVHNYASGSNTDYDAALKFLEENDELAKKMENKVAIAEWNYETNLTETNMKIMLDTKVEEAQFSIATWENATSFSWKDFKENNETIYRWFKKLSILGTAALPEEKLNKFNNLIAGMQDVYAKAEVCGKDYPEDKACDLPLEPDLTKILKTSKDYDELKHVWGQWRDVTGKKVKSQFIECVKLSNEVAKLNGFADMGEMWREKYESETFEEDVEELWKVIEPFYKQIHAFVRRRLIHRYSDKNIKPDGPIPAHLLGDMWALSWGNIIDILKPFPDKEFVDVTENMIKENMTPLKMYKMSEEFFTSLGLKPMTPEFWNRSIIEKPSDRKIVCHAAALDFADGKDFRIMMCTNVNMEDLMVVHHEMGHIQYFQQYAHLPQVFRDGANPGFHEAVGDALALSVRTPKHLMKIGLMESREEDEETDLNSLMKIALEHVVFLPFGYLIDSYRWKVFSGEISEEELNSKWWEMRLKYQGICPPIKRTNDDLDAAAQFHVIASAPYIRYFVSEIIQFQFHKALCEVAGHEGPLHKCDIYQSKEAGKLLSDVLSLGSSVHWTKAMSIITKGKTDKMDAQPMIEYFEPLMNWLKNQTEGEELGWKSLDPMVCPQDP